MAENLALFCCKLFRGACNAVTFTSPGGGDGAAGESTGTADVAARPGTGFFTLKENSCGVA